MQKSGCVYEIACECESNYVEGMGGLGKAKEALDEWKERNGSDARPPQVT